MFYRDAFVWISRSTLTWLHEVFGGGNFGVNLGFTVLPLFAAIAASDGTIRSCII